jgi:cell division protein FtsI (penicillin-binding protein 3)
VQGRGLSRQNRLQVFLGWSLMSSRNANYKDARTVIIIICVFVWGLFIFGRLIQKQVVEHDDYVRKAEMQQQSQDEINAPRGIIYDSRMDPLATNTTLSRVIAEPRRIEDIPGTAEKLASILGIDRKTLLARMEMPARRAYLVVERRIDEKKEKAIKDLNLEGVYFEDENVRSYPGNDLACHVLGFVNMNGDGGAGIEQEYDKYLKGKPGLYTFARDGRRNPRIYQTQMEVQPVQGNNLFLSIDKSIQYIADRELAAGVENAGARAGTAIVMEPGTGRILAMSNYPRFDSNKYNEYKSEYWYNRALTGVFDPGSTFKVPVIASVLQEGVTRQDELIDCQSGTFSIGGHVIRDTSSYGRINFQKILAVSSNVGAAKLGLKMGRERLYESIRAFGFGLPTGIDLPQEDSGILHHWNKWSELSTGQISYGYEISVTSLQMLTAVNVIANGGFRVRPSIVDRIIDSEGNLIRENTPERERILDEKTASDIADALKNVLLPGGTARRAALNGYVAAGKTGTAQKLVKDPVTGKNQYSRSRYIASFIGFAPLPNPRITVLVQLDEPRNGYYGGEVSAPIFQKITQETLMRLKVPPDPALAPVQPKQKSMTARNDLIDFLPDAVSAEPIMTLTENMSNLKDQPGVITVRVGNENIVVPDFRGMSKRRVLDICMELDIRLKSEGSGVAVSQFPPPGTRVAPGDTFSVVFMKSEDVVSSK